MYELVPRIRGRGCCQKRLYRGSYRQERVIDPAEDLLSELDVSGDDADVTSSEADPDMDLVKSLIAGPDRRTITCMMRTQLNRDLSPSEAMLIDIDDEGQYGRCHG
jgi:hypothetical protein